MEDMETDRHTDISAHNIPEPEVATAQNFSYEEQKITDK